jgi:16S rRNA G966 N2-methylase RsmD
MNNIYYANFIPGLNDFIASVVKERLADVKIHRVLDGAVLFETGINYDKLNFFCFNNIFAVIDIMEHPEGNSKAIETHIFSLLSGKTALQDTVQGIISSNNKKIKTFRIIISRENTPSAIGEKLRMDAEKYISRLSQLKVNRSRSDAEFWFLYRSEKFSLFMKRLTLRQSWEKSLHQGELPPPLAWSLCALAGLKDGQTVLDPFCGYGSIPEEAFKHFHIRKFIACDNDKDTALYSEKRFKNRTQGEFILYKTDFSKLSSFIEGHSIDALVTDPPWGHYIEVENQFYGKMFDVFNDLLKPGARSVVLCADKEIKVIPSCFILLNSIPILLSGRKAVIFVLEKLRLNSN